MHQTESETNSSASGKVYTRKKELLWYLHLLDTDPVIQRFLKYDRYYCLADKYLIAMVFIYFKRAEIPIKEYTYLNFFAGLCLALSMEEDINFSYEVYPWALGENYTRDDLNSLIRLKDLLWHSMDFRSAVSHHCCTQVISIVKSHPVWTRARQSWFLDSYVSLAVQRMLKDVRRKRLKVK